MRAALLLPFVAMIACSAPAGVPPERDPRRACETDADCVVSTFEGCCARCPCGAPHPRNARHDESARADCANVRCAAPEPGPPCPACETGTIRAVCHDGLCALVL